MGKPEFYLGSGTPNGFISLFSESYDTSWRVIILKGGPGSGKSTLMKRIADEAEKRGELCERIYCSSDPNSLDGVLIPGLKRAMFDGTAPHVMEPKLPGACESVLSTGTVWKLDALAERRAILEEINAECAAFHAQAKRYIACAGAFLEPVRRSVMKKADGSKLSSYAAALAKKLGKGDGAAESRRLLTAVTPSGLYTRAGTPSGYGCDVIPIEDRSGFVSGMLFEQLKGMLLENGHKLIACPSPVTGMTEHIILPDCGKAFCSVKEPSEDFDGRMVHCERFLSEPFEKEEKTSVASGLRDCDLMLARACETLSSALAAHDRLEAVYKEASDFSATEELYQKAIEILLD